MELSGLQAEFESLIKELEKLKSYSESVKEQTELTKLNSGASQSVIKSIQTFSKDLELRQNSIQSLLEKNANSLKLQVEKFEIVTDDNTKKFSSDIKSKIESYEALKNDFEKIIKSYKNELQEIVDSKMAQLNISFKRLETENSNINVQLSAKLDKAICELENTKNQFEGTIKRVEKDFNNGIGILSASLTDLIDSRFSKIEAQIANENNQQLELQKKYFEELKTKSRTNKRLNLIILIAIILMIVYAILMTTHAVNSGQFKINL
ncbi:MAG: hypothetical protein ACPGLV_06415 [Bacteroidia bacterium]